MKSSVDYISFVKYAFENLARAEYDDFVWKNCEASEALGTPARLTRTSIGKCCDYCDGLTGSWNYADHDYPEDVFKRHSCCRCVVAFSRGKGHYQDIWTKKEFTSSRELVKERVEAVEREMVNDAEFLQRKLMARSNNEPFVDATEYYRRKRKIYPAKIVDTPQKFTFRDMDFDWTTSEADFEPTANERSVGRWLAARFGGVVQFMPKINTPQKCRAPDYLWDGIGYDLKSPRGGKKKTVRKRIEGAKGQANRVVLDRSASPLSLEDVIKQSETCMKTNADWLEQIIIISRSKNGFSLDCVLEKP